MANAFKQEFSFHNDSQHFLKMRRKLWAPIPSGHEAPCPPCEWTMIWKSAYSQEEFISDTQKKLFKSLLLRIREGFLIKVLFARSSAVLSNSNLSLESQNAKTAKASKGYFRQSLYFTDKETEAYKRQVYGSRPAIENRRDEARFESPNSQSNELSYISSQVLQVHSSIC